MSFSSSAGSDVRGKRSDLSNSDKSLKMMHAKIESILSDLVPKSNYKTSLSKYSKFNPLTSISMDMPSRRSFNVNPITSYHTRGKKDMEPSQESQFRSKANLTELTNQFQKKINEIACIDGKALIPMPEVEDRFSVLNRKNFFTTDGEEDELNFSDDDSHKSFDYTDDRCFDSNFLPSFNPRRAEECSFVQMKQEFRKNVITKVSELGIDK